MDEMPDASILVVCTANICRSPMAEALLKARVPPGEHWRIESAGTWAMDGQLVSTNTQLVLQQRGLDASLHRSRSVNSELIKDFNLILVMEPGHKEALQVEFPQAAGRIFLFSEMVGMKYPVVDPYGRPLKDYLDTARELDQIFEAGFETIARLARGTRPSAGEQEP
jgi:protein-tyrosine phosphatase